MALKTRKFPVWVLLIVTLISGGWFFLGNEISNPQVVVPYDGQRILGASPYPKGPGGSRMMRIKEDGMVYWNAFKRTVVSANVRSSRECSWDGEKWIYYDNLQNAILSWSEHDNEWQVLLDLTSKGLDNVSALYHVDGFLIFKCPPFTYQYSITNDELVELDFWIDESEWSFIYQDWLLNVQVHNEFILAYCAHSGTKIHIDLTLTGLLPDDFPTNAAYASDEQYLYLSLYKCNKLSNDVIVEGTYAINLETWEMLHLSDKYYSSLRRTSTGLYGWGIIPIPLPDDTK